MEPNQPFNPQQPQQSPFQSQQPANPVPAQPVMEPVQPAQPVQPVQPMPPVQPKKNNKNLILGIILGLIIIAIIILILVMFVFNKPNGQDSGSGNSGSSSNNSSNGSGDNSGDSSNYANAPDTIASCPGCVYATSEKNKSNYVYSSVAAEVGGYEYEPLAEENYSTSWKEIVENSGREIFYGYVLDDNKYAVRGFVCGIEKDTPFCIEGALTDRYGGNATTRQEIYAKNVEVLNSIYDNCIENTPMGAYYCSGDVEPAVYFVDDYDLPGTVQMWTKSACLNAAANGLGYTSTVSDNCKK